MGLVLLGMLFFPCLPFFYLRSYSFVVLISRFFSKPLTHKNTTLTRFIQFRPRRPNLLPSDAIHDKIPRSPLDLPHPRNHLLSRKPILFPRNPRPQQSHRLLPTLFRLPPLPPPPIPRVTRLRNFQHARIHRVTFLPSELRTYSRHDGAAG